MSLNLSWLDDSLALVESGNFSRAAEERHMTQPAFSRRIRALEEWLGTELFDRSSQPARLTAAGEWFRNAHLASVLRTMALDGRGLAWLPRSLIEEDLASGRLVGAAPDDWHIELEIRLYRARSSLGEAAEAFLLGRTAGIEPGLPHRSHRRAFGALGSDREHRTTPRPSAPSRGRVAGGRLATQSRPSPLERRGRKADVDDPSCSVRRPQRN